MLLITLLVSLLLHSKYFSCEISQGAISVSFISLDGFLYEHIECNVLGWLPEFIFWYIISQDSDYFSDSTRLIFFNILWNSFLDDLELGSFLIFHKRFYWKVILFYDIFCWNDLWVSVYLFASWRSFMLFENFPFVCAVFLYLDFKVCFALMLSN